MIKLALLINSLHLVSAFSPTTTLPKQETSLSKTQLSASLKPAAIPLLASGKALARSGELLIEVTTNLDLYGGALSAAGANIRNSGDAVAQAAASCRFKTAAELVCDELREGATCLLEGVDKCQAAIGEAEVDEQYALMQALEGIIPHLSNAGTTLETSGRGIMQRAPINEIGDSLFQCGYHLGQLAFTMREISPEMSEMLESSQRMAYASEQMMEAGNNLRGVIPEKPKGKAWLKG